MLCLSSFLFRVLVGQVLVFVLVGPVLVNITDYCATDIINRYNPTDNRHSHTGNNRSLTATLKPTTIEKIVLMYVR